MRFPRTSSIDLAAIGSLKRVEPLSMVPGLVKRQEDRLSSPVGGIDDPNCPDDTICLPRSQTRRWISVDLCSKQCD
jgi:hypothetical protein